MIEHEELCEPCTHGECDQCQDWVQCVDCQVTVPCACPCRGKPSLLCEPCWQGGHDGCAGDPCGCPHRSLPDDLEV